MIIGSNPLKPLMLDSKIGRISGLRRTFRRCAPFAVQSQDGMQQPLAADAAAKDERLADAGHVMPVSRERPMKETALSISSVGISRK